MKLGSASRFMLNVLAARLTCSDTATTRSHVVTSQVRALTVIACLVDIAALLCGCSGSRHMLDLVVLVVLVVVVFFGVRKTLSCQKVTDAIGDAHRVLEVIGEAGERGG